MSPGRDWFDTTTPEEWQERVDEEAQEREYLAALEDADEVSALGAVARRAAPAGGPRAVAS